MPRCGKKRLDKIKAMMIVANAQSPSQKNHKRKETAYYFCDKCKSYHVTSIGRNESNI